MKQVLILVIFFLYLGVSGQINSTKYTKDYIPKSLDEAVEYLYCNWDNETKNDFKEKDEKRAVTELHFGTGMGIRNSFGLWRKESEIVKYFNQCGITHPDDMSSIILTSFHRKLNGKDIELEKQIEYYESYWTRIRERQNSEIKEMQDNYVNYLINDTITFFMPKPPEFLKGMKNVIVPIKPNWEFDKEKDLRIIGVIIRKEMIKDSVDAIFDIKIIESNQNGVFYTCWDENLNVGDTTIVKIKHTRSEYYH